jgi:hypothetical protein
MTTTGPDDRERFAQRDATDVPLSSTYREPEVDKAPKVVAGGSIVEALCGAATVVLAILALTGTQPEYLASIATIVFGVALIAHGGAIGARFHELTREARPREWEARTELGGGMGAELVGGAAGVVLGVLGLLGVATATLIHVAVIIFGGALLLSSFAMADLGTLGAPRAYDRFSHIAREASMAASGTQALVGMGAVVLGLLALTGLDPMVLTLVALLALGSAVVLSGAALSSRMAAVIRR